MSNDPKSWSDDKAKRMLAAMVRQQESEETIGNVDAAATWAEKITNLLAKYDLTEADLADPVIGFELVDPIYHRLSTRFRRIEWMVRLATYVSEAEGARVLFPVEKDNNQLFFVGTKAGRAASIRTFTHLARLAISLSKAELSLFKKNGGSEGRGWRESFVEAFTNNIISRLGRVDAPIAEINAFIGTEYGFVNQIELGKDEPGEAKHTFGMEMGTKHGRTVKVTLGREETTNGN